jgi:hypothetical protein
MKLLIMSMMLALVATANAQVGHDGNGGGGIYANGEYKTFYSAGLFVNAIPKSLQTSAGLNQLVRQISASPYLTTPIKTRLLKAILPASNRNYYDVQANRFGDEVQARLKAEYERATKTSAEQIVLYAVTDTNSKNTYLLPNFYRLNLYGQMAILFHEAMWILTPDSTYASIIGAEVTFQAYLEQSNDYASVQRFIRLVGGVADEARLAYNWDKRTGIIRANGTIVDGNQSMVFSMVNLMGPLASESPDVMDYMVRQNGAVPDRLQTQGVD